MGVKKAIMECIHCQNCKQGHTAYFCAAKNEFVIDTSKQAVLEKQRGGWKKGDADYESHRRKRRKEVEEY